MKSVIIPVGSNLIRTFMLVQSPINSVKRTVETLIRMHKCGLIIVLTVRTYDKKRLWPNAAILYIIYLMTFPTPQANYLF